MIRYERSKSSMFLLEILINILLFIVLCVCSLQFFIKAYQLTENTTVLHHAVTACNNVAAVYHSGDGSTTAIKEIYTKAFSADGLMYIYLDESYQECDSQNVTYYLVIEEKFSEIPSISITFYKNGEDAAYSIDVFHYRPLSPSIVDSIGTSMATSIESEGAANE